MKVMNGLVHGDTRSHAILSPGTIFAGASHTCESIAVLMNTAYAEHGNLPLRASVQLDNAATNHNMLVLVFMGLYARTDQMPRSVSIVLHGVCRKYDARVTSILA